MKNLLRAHRASRIPQSHERALRRRRVGHAVVDHADRVVIGFLMVVHSLTLAISVAALGKPDNQLENANRAN
jgi:hypothetical protein